MCCSHYWSLSLGSKFGEKDIELRPDNFPFSVMGFYEIFCNTQLLSQRVVVPVCTALKEGCAVVDGSLTPRPARETKILQYLMYNPKCLPADFEDTALFRCVKDHSHCNDFTSLAEMILHCSGLTSGY